MFRGTNKMNTTKNKNKIYKIVKHFRAARKENRLKMFLKF